MNVVHMPDPVVPDVMITVLVELSQLTLAPNASLTKRKGTKVRWLTTFPGTSRTTGALFV